MLTMAFGLVAAAFAAGCAPASTSVGRAASPVRTFDALEAHAGFAVTEATEPGSEQTGDAKSREIRGTYVDEGTGDKTPGRRPSRATAPSGGANPQIVDAAAAVFQSSVAETNARCPADMSLVGGRVCVDRWEASLVHLVKTPEGVREEAITPYQSVDDMTGYRAVSRPGVVPQGYISGLEAESACRASGKRLCTASEWELGCRGPQNTQFPYGNERRAHVCNDDIRARHPVIEAVHMAGLPHDKTWKDGMNLPTINQLPDSLLPTGDRSECVTPDGLFDMVGNLHEWVADADGTFRGGYYMDTSKNGDGCSYQTTAHDFDYHDYSTGFRCCADPDSIE